MKSELPDFHEFQRNGQHYAILLQPPLIFKMSPLMSDILREKRKSTAEADLIKSLARKYEMPQIEEAIHDFGELIDEVNSRRIAPAKTSHPLEALSIQIPTVSQSVHRLICRASEFLSENSEAALSRTLILHLQTFDYNGLEQLLKSLAKACSNNQSEIHIVLSMPLTALDKPLFHFVKKFGVSFQFVTNPSVPQAVMRQKLKIAMQLLLQTDVAVRIQGHDSDAVVGPLRILLQTGIPLVHLDYGICDFSQHAKALAGFGMNGGFSISTTEIVSYLSMLYESAALQRPCGTGVWYLALSAEGDFYPCHELIGNAKFKLGNIFAGGPDDEIIEQLTNHSSSENTACSDCWANQICGGGCSLFNLQKFGAAAQPDKSRCEVMKKNIELAALIFCRMNDAEKFSIVRKSHLCKKMFPYLNRPAGANTSDENSLILKSNGHSMEPLISAGTLLKVKIEHPARLKIGDIFCYRKNNVIITHRLVMKFRSGSHLLFIEKGDNAGFSETTAEKILGKVLAIQNPDKAEFMPLNTPTWRIAGKTIAAITILLSSLFFIIRFGLKFFLASIKYRGNIIQAFKLVSSTQPFRSRVPYFRRICKFPNSLIIKFCLLLKT